MKPSSRDLQLTHGLCLVSLSQSLFSTKSEVDFAQRFSMLLQKGRRRKFSIIFTRIDHRNDTIKCSEQGEQSTFLILWVVSKSTHFGVLPFRFVEE